jgi:hypothetical protein
VIQDKLLRSILLVRELGMAVKLPPKGDEVVEGGPDRWRDSNAQVIEIARTHLNPPFWLVRAAHHSAPRVRWRGPSVELRVFFPACGL